MTYPSLFDLHCDTATSLFAKKQALYENNCHISLKKASLYPKYRQIMAVWSDRRLSDEEAFERFLEVTRYIAADPSFMAFPLVTDGKDLPPRAYFLAVEDARLLGGKRDRLSILYEHGVRLLTLLWSGDTVIGGSHDSESGLTAFGKQVLDDCFELGILPDISHASARSTDEMLERATECGKAVIATHSNAFAVCPHTRNLTDERFLKLKATGGIIGLCLCPSHLARNPKEASLDHAVRHIEHWLSLGGEDCIALGCDLDGTDLPSGISSVSDLHRLAELLGKRGYSDALIEKLFHVNAENFVKNTLHK